MSKVFFAPFGAIGGLLAGVVGKKTFEGLWGVIDKREAPDPKQREVSWQKLLLALLLEGAIFRAVRGLFDHASRRAFRKLTGSWPGKQRPDPA
jgi:Protein of unknown function (DUF4235)